MSRVTHTYLVLGTELRALCVLDKHCTALWPVVVDLLVKLFPTSMGRDPSASFSSSLSLQPSLVNQSVQGLMAREELT